MKDTTYRVVETKSPRGLALRWKVLNKETCIGQIRLTATVITVKAKDQTLEGCLRDVVNNHTGKTYLRRVKHLQSYMMLYDAFDQHTADNHYMEITSYLCTLQDGVEIDPAAMFAVMVQCRAGGPEPEPGEDRYP